MSLADMHQSRLPHGAGRSGDHTVKRLLQTSYVKYGRRHRLVRDQRSIEHARSECVDAFVYSRPACRPTCSVHCFDDHIAGQGLASVRVDKGTYEIDGSFQREGANLTEATLPQGRGVESGAARYGPRGGVIDGRSTDVIAYEPDGILASAVEGRSAIINRECHETRSSYDRVSIEAHGIQLAARIGLREMREKVRSDVRSTNMDDRRIDEAAREVHA